MLACFSTVLADHPDNARIWVAYADALKTAGRQADAIDVYRRACALAPGFGEAWWSLSNLKTFEFAPADVATMEAQLAGAALSSEDRLHLHFALGKAREDSGEFAGSFANYAEGNRIRRASLTYDAAAPSAYVDRARSLYDAEFFAARLGWGHDAPDPIFIVGLPRSGSTLIEQILASHSAVEGTMELPDVAAIAGSLVGSSDAILSRDYPGMVAGLTAERFREIGGRYLKQTRVYRRHEKPFFIDKMPNNYGIKHPDHRAAGQIVIDAVFPAVGNHVYFRELLEEGFQPHMPKEVWCSLTMQPNTTMDVTETWEVKLQAILEHKTQVQDPEKLKERFKSRRAEDSTEDNPRYEEKFKVIKYS